MSVYHTKNRKARNKIDLLRLVDNKNNHYCLIKNFSNLVHFLTRSKLKQGKGPKFPKLPELLSTHCQTKLQEARYVLRDECTAGNTNA